MVVVAIEVAMVGKVWPIILLKIATVVFITFSTIYNNYNFYNLIKPPNYLTI